VKDNAIALLFHAALQHRGLGLVEAAAEGVEGDCFGFGQSVIFHVSKVKFVRCGSKEI
jgi:hypothetical protein